MRSANVPVEVLDLQVKREGIGDKRVERRGDFSHRSIG